MIQSRLAETPEYIVENTSVLEVLDLHIGIQTNLNLETLSIVSCHPDLFVHLEITLSQINTEGLLACQTYIVR